MRLAFIGTNALTLTTAEMLLEQGHEVVLIERDKARIETLSERLDCGFLLGDGTEPDVLRDAEPENTDVLFCLLESDQTNIIASLVGRSLGFGRVVPRIADPQFQRICNELGLENTVLPNRAVASHLVDLLQGQKSLEMSSLIRGDAEVFSFVVDDDKAGDLETFELPNDTRIICLYRDDEFTLPEQISELKPGDEVILVTHRERLPELKERWAPRNNRPPVET
ncbi:MAG: TrkA family potassium uptake protein [Chromatiaceae bacterium]|jgi:trk system potassium uptake protein